MGERRWFELVMGKIWKILHWILVFNLLRHSGKATGSWLNWQRLGNWPLAEDAWATSGKRSF